MNAAAIPILITRAEPGASQTEARIAALGLHAVKSPVLEIRARSDESLPDLSRLSGLVFSSANGVRAFADRSADRRLDAWCVGPATAAAARAAGFAQVHESAGNAVDLAKFIVANSAPSSGPLLHIANIAAKGDLKRTLEAHGYKVVFAPLYEMRGTDSLSRAAIQVLREDRATIVLIHSAKGAEAFARFCARDHSERLTVVAISAAAAQPLAFLHPSAVHVAANPNEDSLLDTLASAIATLSA